MVARGYTAEEILSVMGRGDGKENPQLPNVPPAKPMKHAAYTS
jgi:hypothetical protein